MDISYLAAVLLAVFAAAYWLRDQLFARLQPTYRARVFLSLHSRETEEVLGTNIPRLTAHLYKDLTLPLVPQPGLELDGLGTGPLKIARAVVEQDASHSVFLQLLPLAMPLEDIEPYANTLVTDLSWQRTQLQPPYPAVVPNNSFEPKPLRGSA